MLNWYLTKSYQHDGSFKISELDDTIGDAYRYGVHFLREAGYFRREGRFCSRISRAQQEFVTELRPS